MGWPPRSAVWTSCPKWPSDRPFGGFRPQGQASPNLHFLSQIFPTPGIPVRVLPIILCYAVKKGFPLHRGWCNNGGPRIALAKSESSGGPSYVDRETGGRGGASADSPRSALRNAVIVAAALFVVDVSQFPHSSACRIECAATENDRPHVQRTKCCFVCVRRRVKRTAGHRHNRTSATSWVSAAASTSLCGE
jgi:hypothetical protein